MRHLRRIERPAGGFQWRRVVHWSSASTRNPLKLPFSGDRGCAEMFPCRKKLGAMRMISSMLTRRTSPLIAASAAILIALAGGIFAQPPAGGGRGGPPPSPKQQAPEDLTGYWVSVVTEGWRYRMITPAKGDYGAGTWPVPLNAEGIRVTNAWDPAKDEAEGNACKAYGGAGIMRIPTRMHITWQDDNTLKVETDAGTQTRLFHFGGSPPANLEPSWQGYSVASWEVPAPGRGGRGGVAPAPPAAVNGAQNQRAGTLKVVTTHLKPGYLRKNGVPYSANTTVTEYFNRTNEPNGDSWLFDTTIVEDPVYLQGPFITSENFKHQAGNAGWAPSGCEAR
jgi:hypothetical protein